MNQERIGLIGLNGAGKTTLIKSLVGALPILEGDLIQHQKLNIGYFSQQQLDALDYENTPIGHMLKHYPLCSESEARRFLGGFNFSGDRVFDPVTQFSGGEKARLVLARMLFKPPNVLILDEPTNHLDIESKQTLLEALAKYEGTIIFVSHDRHFLEALATNVLEIDGGSAKTYHGGYNKYVEFTGHAAPGS